MGKKDGRRRTGEEGRVKKDGRRRTGERKKDGWTDGRAGGRKDGRTDGRTADRQAENLGRKEKGDGKGGSFLVEVEFGIRADLT